MESTVVRVHTYRVESENLPEFLTRRAAVIDLIRADNPGLVSTRLVRVEDGSFLDTWSWKSMEAMTAAFPLARSPEAALAWSLATASSAMNGEVIDER